MNLSKIISCDMSDLDLERQNFGPNTRIDSAYAEQGYGYMRQANGRSISVNLISGSYGRICSLLFELNSGLPQYGITLPTKIPMPVSTPKAGPILLDGKIVPEGLIIDQTDIRMKFLEILYSYPRYSGISSPNLDWLAAMAKLVEKKCIVMQSIEVNDSSGRPMKEPETILYYRHLNKDGTPGRLVEITIKIGSDVKLSAESRIIGTSYLSECIILGKTIVEDSEVYNSIINDSRLKKSSSTNSRVSNSKIDESKIEFSIIGDSRIRTSELCLTKIYGSEIRDSKYRNQEVLSKSITGKNDVPVNVKFAKNILEQLGVNTEKSANWIPLPENVNLPRREQSAIDAENASHVSKYEIEYQILLNDIRNGVWGSGSTVQSSKPFFDPNKDNRFYGSPLGPGFTNAGPG